MEIKSLEQTSLSAIFEAFEKAFSDYEVQLKENEFYSLLKRRGFDQKMSFAAFEEDTIVAFTLNGIGLFDNKKTAYDTGTGTPKEFRGQGLATKIFEHSIPVLKENQVECYLLEVLQHNTKAVSIYKKLGFSITREFNYFIWDTQTVNFESKAKPIQHIIKPFTRDDDHLLRSFCYFSPSWQNSFESINRASDDFYTYGAFEDNTLLGYCLFEPQSGDIAQIAVSENHRRKGIGTALLQFVQQTHAVKRMKLINAATNCQSLELFLKAHHIDIQGKQFEMVKEL